MEPFWKGAFGVPQPVQHPLRKSIGTVRFVPISEMTPRDWRWLDFDNTRTVAQNRIARMIMAGSLRGFFQVMITEKAAKNEYFWPATDTMVDEFVDTDDPTFFMHEPETLTENQASEALTSLRTGMGFLSFAEVMGIVGILTMLSVSNNQELQAIREDYLQEMEREDVEILLSAIMMWEMSLEEAEAVLDDLPESDEADVVRDWINDKVAEIQAARAAVQPIAAGRGLTGD